MVEFEGWTGEVDWNDFYDNIWTPQPARQVPPAAADHPTGTSNEITFTGGVRGTVANGKRSLYVGDAKVLDGDRYLLPWEATSKLYHYNPDGGRPRGRCPRRWRRVEVHRLQADRQRPGKVGTVRRPPGRQGHAQRRGGSAVRALPGRPGADAADPALGEGRTVKDPGFNAGNLNAWKPARSPATSTTRRPAPKVAASGRRPRDRAAVSGLDAGQTTARRPGSRSSPARPGRRHSACGRRHDASSAHRAEQGRVGRQARHLLPAGRVRLHRARERPTTLRIAAGKGSARCGSTTSGSSRRPADAPGAVVYEDFENVDQGWGPFVKGDAGGSTDPRTHLAQQARAVHPGRLERQAGRRRARRRVVPEGARGEQGPGVPDHPGDRAVRARAQVQGGFRLPAATPATTVGPGYDRIVGGAPATEVKRIAIGQQRTRRPYQDVRGGLRRGQLDRSAQALEARDQADLVLDDFTVTDLGPAEAADCTVDRRLRSAR